MSYPKQILPEGFQFPSQPPPPPTCSTLNIHKAVELNNWEKCKELLTNDISNISAKGWNGMSPLHSACIRNHIKIIELLLEHKADVNARTNFDETPFHYACRNGSVKLVSILIKAGADQDLIDKKGRGAMHFAALGSSIPVIKYLELKTHLKTHCVDANGHTPLYYACSQKNINLIKFLLRSDRSVISHKDLNGETVLHVIARSGDAHVIWKVLNTKGATCGLTLTQNSKGETPLDILNNTKYKDKNVQKLMVKELKLYMKQNKNETPEKPNLLWLMYLIFPFIYMLLVFYICNLFSAYSGYFIIVTLICMYSVIFKQTHRISHVSGWPNPVYLGLFIGSFSHCTFAYFYKLYSQQQNGTDILTLFVFSFLWAKLMWFLLKGDPGLIKQDDLPVKAFNKPLDVTDIPSGRCTEIDFCPYTEVIRPRVSKFCRICEHVVILMDHHCLFLNNCIARNNHREFVLMLFVTMVMQLSFFKAVCNYLYVTEPLLFDKQNWLEIVEHLMKSEAWLFGLCLVCLMAFITELTLIIPQLRNILYGDTSYYSGKIRKKNITYKDYLNNVIRFFSKKTVKHSVRDEVDLI